MKVDTVNSDIKIVGEVILRTAERIHQQKNLVVDFGLVYAATRFSDSPTVPSTL